MNTSKVKEKDLKTRKGILMKKNTLEAMRNYLNGDETVDLSVLREEVNAEWERTTAKARANADVYAVAHDVLMDILPETPMTVKEIFALSEDWPEGFTTSKLQYAMTRMWQDEINKVENAKSANQYSRKA